MVQGRQSFHAVDYAIFGAMLASSMAIGMFFAFHKKKDYSSADYFFGGKKMRSIPVALSFVVTFQSSLMILGYPAEVYGYGMKYSLMLIGVSISFILGAIIVVPIFRPLQITSIYKYFTLRYGSNEVRFVAAAGGIVYFVFYMAVVVLGTCVALRSVLGVPFWATVITYTVITTIYTSLGGFKAVIWTDVFQLVVMVTGILATLIKSTIKTGGSSAVHKLAKERFYIEDFRMDPTLRYTVWICMFGPITQFLVMFFTQAGFQRIKSTQTTKSTYIMIFLSTPLYCAFGLLCCFEGVALFSYYSSTGCDPLASGRISNINEVVPTGVLDLFGDIPGLLGLFIASLSSAALSTLSSCLTGLSSITFEDIIKIRYPTMSDKNATNLSKAVVFIYGAISMGLTFLMSLLSGPVTAIFQAAMGSIDGPTCGIFVLSIFFRRSTTKGMLFGALSGMLVSMTLNLGQTFVTVPSYEYLPLGPTGSCVRPSLSNISVNFSNTSNEPAIYLPVLPTLPSSMNSTSSMYIDSSADDNAVTLLQKVFGVSFMLFSLIGFLVTIIIGCIVSLLTKPTPKEMVDNRTLYPVSDRLCSIFPDSFFYSKTDKMKDEVTSEEADNLMKANNENEPVHEISNNVAF